MAQDTPTQLRHYTFVQKKEPKHFTVSCTDLNNIYIHKATYGTVSD